jgi:hypothetical protein
MNSELVAKRGSRLRGNDGLYIENNRLLEKGTYAEKDV